MFGIFVTRSALYGLVVTIETYSLIGTENTKRGSGTHISKPYVSILTRQREISEQKPILLAVYPGSMRSC